MITKVKVHGWQRYVPVNALVVEVILIAEDMGVLLACNLPQSQDTNIQTDASENRHWGQRGYYPGGKLRIF